MKDILIVGFGLAGLSVANHAFKNDLSFDIIDDSSQLSSKIAGGILNPIAIKRMKPVWKLEDFLPYALTYYSSLEKLLSSNFITKKKIEVYLQDNYKENLWFEALDNRRLQSYLSTSIEKCSNTCVNFQNVSHIDAYLLDLSTLFSSSQLFYDKVTNFSHQKLEYTNIHITPNYISHQDTLYKHIVFCEGYGIVHNPLFPFLDIYGNKGDYLIIKSPDLNEVKILKSKYFLIPLGNDMYKFGATYQREPLNHIPSKIASQQLLEALDSLLDCPYEIIDQVCGIRPTVKDRKPILGSHNLYKNIHVLNGFGSRGVMTSPLLGKMLIDYIFNGVDLDKEISINRFYPPN